MEGRAARPLSGRRDRRHLGVRPPRTLVPALADDLAVADDDGADDGVRARGAAPALRELERAIRS